MTLGTESLEDSTVSKDSPPVNPELELSRSVCGSEGDVALDVDSLAEDTYEVVRRKTGVSLYFKDVKYEVNVDVNAGSQGCLRWMRKNGSKSKEILHGISGYVRPGEMLAVMGPSGSGKTTLLNILAGRLGQPSEGELLFGGKQRDKRTRRKVAYVTQEDLFFSNLTVHEVLTFTAHVRLPDSMTVPEKDARVDVVLEKLNLQKTANTKIGDGLFNKGISGGERKRVGIANELLTDPYVILLDEPTSGLDSNTALTVVQILKRLSLDGKTVVTTIHQPSSQMFQEFDKLLLLSEGNSVFFGDAKDAFKYFSKLGMECPFGYNLADFYMQLLTDEDLHGTQPVKAKLVEAWKEEEKGLFLDHTEFDNERSNTRRFFTDSVVSSFRSVVKSVRSLPSNFIESMGRSEPVEDISWDDDRKYATSWNTQFRNLSQRAFRQKRGQVTEIWPIIHLCCTLVLVGIVWFRMPETEATINDRVGNLFFSCIFWGFFTMLSATYAFPTEKAVIRKDRSSGAYRLSAYFLAKSTAEIPLDVIYPIVWGSIVYWLVGLNPNIDRFFIYLFLLVTNVLLAQSFGLAISVAVMNVQKATVLASVVMLASLMVAGFYVATENLPSWIRWVQYLSFIVYSFAALMLNEFNGQTYTCTEPPTEFRLGECPIQDEYVYETYDLTFNLGVWGNWGIMMAWIIGLRLLAYVFLRTLHNKHKKA